MYSSSDYTWEHNDFDIRPHIAQHLKYPPLHPQHSPSARTPRRRRNSYTKQRTQQTYSPTLQQRMPYGRSPCFVHKDHLNVAHGPYCSCPEEAPADYLLDNYYMESVPVSPWSAHSEPQRRTSLTQPRPYHDEWDDDDQEDYYHDDTLFHPSPPLSRRRSFVDPSPHYNHFCQAPRKSSRSYPRPTEHNYYQPHIVDLDIDDYSDEGDFHVLHQRKHYDHHPHHRDLTPPYIDAPSRRSSQLAPHQPPRPVLHRQWHPRLDQGPVLDTDVQQHPPPSLYPQVAPILQHPMFPMLQPMIHAPQPLQPSTHHNLNPIFPTAMMPAPEPAMPFNPMIMPQPSHFPIGDTTNMGPQPTPPPSSPEESTKEPPHTASDTTNTPSSTPTTVPANDKPENSLIPLVRSLSLGSSSSSQSKPRRRSLFESLFSSTSSSSSSRTNSLTSTDSSLIPVNEITTHSLSRRQSLSLEKTAKALSQRTYIWCYRRPNDPCWVALSPKNQTRLDPYIGYYHPGASKKGYASTRNLPTLLTLDKEPKLAGSFTAMPQAKIARVYPSLFSSATYQEVALECLPADTQFVVRSD